MLCYEEYTVYYVFDLGTKIRIAEQFRYKRNFNANYPMHPPLLRVRLPPPPSIHPGLNIAPSERALSSLSYSSLFVVVVVAVSTNCSPSSQIIGAVSS